MCPCDMTMHLMPTSMLQNNDDKDMKKQEFKRKSSHGQLCDLFFECI